MPIKCPVCGADSIQDHSKPGSSWKTCLLCGTVWPQDRRTVVTLTVEEIEEQAIHAVVSAQRCFHNGDKISDAHFTGQAAVWRSLLERKTAQPGD